MKHFYLGTVLANPFIPVSAGATDISVPSGQSDPAVTLDLAPAGFNSSEAKGMPQMPTGSETGDGLARNSSDGSGEKHFHAGISVEASAALVESPSQITQIMRGADVATGPSEANSEAPQPRGEAAHTNATQPVASPNFDSVIKELLQICPPLKPWQTPLRIDARHQERAVDDAIADFFDPAPMFLQEPLRRAG